MAPTATRRPAMRRRASDAYNGFAFMTGATSSQTDILAGHMPVVIMLVMMPGAMAMPGRIAVPARPNAARGCPHRRGTTPATVQVAGRLSRDLLPLSTTKPRLFKSLRRSAARSAVAAGLLLRSARGPQSPAGPLLVLDLRKREPGGDRDDIQDWMARIAGQAQCMHLFPCSYADVGGIQIRPLFGQLESPPLRTFEFFECQAFGVSRHGFSRVGRR